jgi:PAP2 superfamily
VPSGEEVKVSVVRRESDNLPRLWVEVVVLGSLYAAYSATRGVADGSVAGALRTGWDIMRLERRLHLDPELALNHWLGGVAVLAVICCYYYATLHFIVTPVVLIWLHRSHPGKYVYARWTLSVATLVSLGGFFLFPTAPPRMLAGSGFLDTMTRFHDWGWWAGDASAAPRGLGGIANQFAAMPSLHCAWALWCGWQIARNARHLPVRIAGALYPAGTVFVVMATGNHYFLDAVAGWAVLGFAVGVTEVGTRLRRRVSAKAVDAPAVDAPAVDAPAVTGTESGVPVIVPAATGDPGAERVREPASG